MASDFIANGIREGVNRIAFLHGESVINSKNNCCENNIEMNKEDIQKQIEAVRGLIEIKNDMDTTLEARPDVMISIWSDRITKELRTLTETLKPFLGDDKLEV